MVIRMKNKDSILNAKCICASLYGSSMLISDEFYNMGSIIIDEHQRDVMLITESVDSCIKVVYQNLFGSVKELTMKAAFKFTIREGDIHFSYKNRPILGIAVIKVMEVKE